MDNSPGSVASNRAQSSLTRVASDAMSTRCQHAGLDRRPLPGYATTIFAGTGPGSTVARGDHDHDVRYAPRLGMLARHKMTRITPVVIGAARHVELRLSATQITGLCAVEVAYHLLVAP